MAADAGLISSFGKLATSEQRDYSGQLRAQREEGKIINKGLSTIAKGIQDKRDAEEKAYKKTNEIKRLQDQSDLAAFNKKDIEVQKNLNDGGGLNEDLGNAFREVMDSTAMEYRSYNTGLQEIKDKSKQAKVFAKVPKFEKGIQKSRTMFSTEKNISKATSVEALKRYEMCRDASEYDNVSVSINESTGEPEFEITTPEYTSKFLGTTFVEGGVTIPASIKTFTLDMLSEDMVEEASDIEAFILASGTAMKEMGAKQPYGTVTPDMLQGEADKLTAEFEKNENIVADLAVRRLTGRSTTKPTNDSGIWEAGSWASDLQEHPSLNMAVYQVAGVEVDGADGSEKDGEVSQAEAEAVMDGPNRNKVIETLVNPKAEGYNHALSSAELGMWVANQHAGYYYNGQSAKNKEASGRNAGLGKKTIINWQ